MLLWFAVKGLLLLIGPVMVVAYRRRPTDVLAADNEHPDLPTIPPARTQ